MTRIPKIKDPLDMRDSRAADQVSINKIRHDDPDGYTELYEKYRPWLRRHLRKFMMIKNLAITPRDIDDHTSEALVTFFEVVKTRQYDPELAPAWPYLKKIVENAALNFWHKHYKRTVHFPHAGTSAQDDLDQLPQTLYDIYFKNAHAIKDAQHDKNDMLNNYGHHVNAFFAHLPATDYALVKLAYFDRKTTREISKIQNISESAVRTRLSRALAKYRKALPLGATLTEDIL